MTMNVRHLCSDSKQHNDHICMQTLKFKCDEDICGT